MKIMKKFLLSMSLMFGALTLTSCAKDAAEENIIPNDGNGFSFVAEIDNTTRATVDGMKTVWEAGDQVGFGGVFEDTTYATCRLYGFDYADGKFSNAKSTFTSANQFYAVWPTALESGKYVEVYTTANTDETKPAHQTKSYFNVGYSKTGVVQNGASAAHIPAVAPMYWMSNGAVAPEALAVKFHHTTALMKFTVKNGEDAALTIKSVRFITPAATKISGTYYINLSTGELVGSGDSYVYNNATVEVENAPALAKGESFDVYMAVAPFVLKANDEINIVVTTTDGATGTVTENVAKDLTFAAGAYNTKTIEFKKDAVVEAPLTVAELVAKVAAGETAFTGLKVKGVVSVVAGDGASLSYGTLILTDNNGQQNSAIKFYNSDLVKAPDLAVGDELLINISGAGVGKYGGVPQITNVKSADIIETTGYDIALVPAKVTVAEYNANYGKYENMYLEFADVEPVQDYDAANATMTFTDGTDQLAIYNKSSWTAGAAIKVGKQKGTLYGFAQSYNSKPQITNTDAAQLAAFAPMCTLSNDALTFAANNGTSGNAPEGQTVTATMASGYALGTATTEAAWLSVLPLEGNGGFLINAQENTGEERTATITVNVMKDGAIADVKTIAVTQRAAGAAAETATYTLTFPDENRASNKVGAYDASWTAKIGDNTWTINNFNNNNWNNNWTFIKCGGKKGDLVGTILTNWAIVEPMEKVVVTIDNYTDGYVNSTKLIVATDVNCNNVVEEVSVPIGKGELEYKISKPTANCYYKLAFDCKINTSKNGLVVVKKVVYTNE